ncbi:DUF2812 domain-containing protein [Shouchella sp. JSM 1781072]|uniref:DUF2812 domain-containing protein n=1 Tax=Bacillaceae TaxID=186817 RepID=UPI0020D182BD|nr:DUF2812 domain-containing protein [Alkalihalobacillus sp. LMS6]UTR06673.1 DUF2812 domain-containing protein [Alkalihalobacillus sp. LMS6]
MKYMMSGGTAFAEKKDMEKLRRMSLKGWHVKHQAFMGYSLEKGEPKEYIYSLDRRSLDFEEQAEYRAYFSDSGWTHIFSTGDQHLFRSAPQSVPLHTDSDTLVEKYNGKKPYVGMAFFLLGLSLILWIGMYVSSSMRTSLNGTVASISAAVGMILLWVANTEVANKWHAQGRKRLGFLLKQAGSVVVYGLPVGIILYVAPVDKWAIVLLSMGIGAALLPFMIWVSMTIYYKWIFAGVRRG